MNYLNLYYLIYIMFDKKYKLHNVSILLYFYVFCLYIITFLFTIIISQNTVMVQQVHEREYANFCYILLCLLYITFGFIPHFFFYSVASCFIVVLHCFFCLFCYVVSSSVALLLFLLFCSAAFSLAVLLSGFYFCPVGIRCSNVLHYCLLFLFLFTSLYLFIFYLFDFLSLCCWYVVLGGFQWAFCFFQSNPATLRAPHHPSTRGAKAAARSAKEIYMGVSAGSSARVEAKEKGVCIRYFRRTITWLLKTRKLKVAEHHTIAH